MNEIIRRPPLVEKLDDRFYVGDVIKNKVTNKVMEVYNIVYAFGSNKSVVLFYNLCNVGEPRKKPGAICYDGERSIPGTAFNNWVKL